MSLLKFSDEVEFLKFEQDDWKLKEPRRLIKIATGTKQLATAKISEELPAQSTVPRCLARRST